MVLANRDGVDMETSTRSGLGFPFLFKVRVPLESS